MILSTNVIIVSRIHVKIALNVVKAWNLVQMKLLSFGSKIELGAFWKFWPCICMPVWLLQTQVFHWRKKIKKIICLHSTNRNKSWKELIKLIKKDFGTTLIGSIVSEIFNPKDTSKLLSQHLWTFLKLTLKRHNLARNSPVHLIYISFRLSFLSSFQL